MDAARIAAIVSMDVFDVERDLQLVSDLFPKRERVYQAFHKSIVDWLTGRVGRSVRFRVNCRGGHQLIASECWRPYQSGADAMSDYAVRHSLYHLHQVDRSDHEVTLMGDPEFIRRRIALGPGIFLSHSFRRTELELVRHVARDLGAMGHFLLVLFSFVNDTEWKQLMTANIPSMSVVIGFTYTRNSPYLQEEWRVARANGVPLVLIMAEESPWLTGTPHLAGVPCFDMRQWRNSSEAYVVAFSYLSALIGKGTAIAQAGGFLGENVARLLPSDFDRYMISLAGDASKSQ
jgi:hypothetical protein